MTRRDRRSGIPHTIRAAKSPFTPDRRVSAKILTIEDNEQNRYLATFRREDQGVEGIHAADGPTGVDLAGRESFDLILLDIQLYLMDGHAVARALRANPELGGTFANLGRCSTVRWLPEAR